MKALLGEQIRKIREMHNVTQEQIAEELGMSRQRFARIEKGLSDISYDVIVAIANFLEILMKLKSGFGRNIIIFSFSIFRNGIRRNKSNSRRVRNTAVNIVVKIPITSVIANPLIAPVPNQNRIKPINMVVKLESKIAENARLKPRSTA